ncbi:MAG: TetR/AcrR family transcriptional regulator [Spirochaetaceae bacterium]|nr:TetR/AcrR family transcriptional regulator [Spirochaetaceae bacterium]
MENKDKLIDVALTLFNDRGYQSVGIQEIVDTVGVSKPTLYHYYNSKLGLLKAIFEQHILGDIKRYEEDAIYNGDFTYSLQKLTFAISNSYKNNPRLYHLLFTYILSSKDSEDYKVVNLYLSKIYNIVVNLFVASKVQNGNMNNREEQFSYSYLAMLIDYLNRHGEEMNNDQFLYSLLHQFQFGINS